MMRRWLIKGWGLILLLATHSLLAGTKIIISIEGGAERGVIPAVFLRSLSAEVGKEPHELFDLMVGTSIGGALALGYSIGLDTQKLENLFFEKATTIFPPYSSQKWLSMFGTLHVKYKAEGLESVLQELYQEKRLSDALVPVMVTTSDIEKDKPFLLKSWVAQDNPQKDFLLWEAARATTAAPTYFEPTQLQKEEERYTLVDGGVCLNNPTMAAFAEGKRLWPNDQLVILSLGTGSGFVSYPYEQAKTWGQLSWLFPMLHLTTNHVSKVVDYQARQILGHENYFRFQPEISSQEMVMDNVSPTHLLTLKNHCLTAYAGFSDELTAFKAVLRNSGKLSNS